MMWHTSDGGWLSFLDGCFRSGCWLRFGNVTQLFLKVIDLVLKTVLCRCLVDLLGHLTFVVFKLCFQLDKPGLLNGSLFFILLFRGSYGVLGMFYILCIGGFELASDTLPFLYNLLIMLCICLCLELLDLFVM